MALQIICFTGHAQNGKDTSADQMEKFLSKRGYHHIQRVSFAQKLKDDAKYLGWDGKKDDRGRELLQRLGDVEKAYHGDTYFAEYLIKQILDGKYKDSEVLLLTDMRFKKEMELFKKLDKEHPDIMVEFVRVVRPKDDSWNDGLTEEARHHQSEVDLDDVTFDITVQNDGTIEDLGEKLSTIFRNKFPTREGSIQEFIEDVNQAFASIL